MVFKIIYSSYCVFVVNDFGEDVRFLLFEEVGMNVLMFFGIVRLMRFD